MTTRRWLFDDQADEAAVTTSNSASTDGVQLTTVSNGTGGAIQYDDAWSYPAGGKSIRMTNGTGANQVRYAPANTHSTGAIDQAVHWSAEVPEQRLFLRVRHASGYILSIGRNTSGRLFVQNTTATVLTGAVTLPLDIRLDIVYSLATGAASNVTIKIWSLAATPDLIETLTLTNADLGATSYSVSSVELFNSGTFTMSLWADSPAIRDDSATSIGPYVVAAIMNAGADQTGIEHGVLVTLDSSASTGSTSRAWQQTAGVASTLSSTSSIVTTFTSPVTLSGTVMTFRVTDVSSSAFDDVNVTVLASTERIVQSGVEVASLLCAVSSVQAAIPVEDVTSPGMYSLAQQLEDVGSPGMYATGSLTEDTANPGLYVIGA